MRSQAPGNDVRDQPEDGRPPSPRQSTITADRDRPGFYVNIVEFES
jgi:hypothetical protein